MAVVSGASFSPDVAVQPAVSADNTVGPSVDGSIQRIQKEPFQQEYASNSGEMMDLLEDSPQPETLPTTAPQVGPTQEALQETQNKVQRALDQGDIDTAIATLDEFATTHDGTELAKQAAQFKVELEAAREQHEIAALRGTEEDPRVQAMREEQERVQKEIDKLSGLNRGSENQIDSWTDQKSEMGLMDRVMGTKGVLQDQIDSERDEIARRDEQIRELREKLDEQERLIQDLKDSEQQGQALQKQATEAQAAGNAELAAELLAQAQDKYNRAQQTTEAFEKISGVRANLFSEKYRQEQQQALEAYDRVIDRIDTTEAVLRTTQKVLIIAGATIATGGAATAVMAAGAGFMAAGATAVLVGTAAGTAIGGAAAATEAVGHVAYGNKTAEEAFDDAFDQTLEHGKDSAIAAVGTVAGVGAGGKVASAVGGKLTGTAGKVVTGAANGATAGGASAVVSSAAGVAQEYHQALEDFEAQYAGVDMTPEERDQLKAEFMAERGLDLEGITARVGRDVAIGIVAGSVGGGMGAAREGVKSTSRAIAAETAEAGADVGIGLGAAALEGDLSAENVADAIGGAVIGNVTGRVSHHSHSKRNGTDSSPSGGNTPEGGPTPRPDTDVDTDVETSGPSTDVDGGSDSAPSSSNSPDTDVDVDVEAAPESYKIEDCREPDSTQGPTTREEIDASVERNYDQNPAKSPQDFVKLSIDDIHKICPPPIEIPSTARKLDPRLTAHGGQTQFNRWDVKPSELNLPNGVKPEGSAKIELYYHSYPEGIGHKPNWRLNVKIQKQEFVGVLKEDAGDGPYALKDFELIPKGTDRRIPDDPSKSDFEARIDRIAGGETLTVEQISELKGSTNGMVAIKNAKPETVNLLIEKGIITQQDFDYIVDLINNRMHLSYGTFTGHAPKTQTAEAT